MGELGGFFDFLIGGIGTAVGDVFFDGAMEEGRLLRHVSDGIAEAGLGDVADVLAIYIDSAFLDVGKPEEEFSESGLARARDAYEADAFAGGDVKSEISEEGVFLFIVLKGEVGKFDGSVFDLEGAVGFIVDKVGEVENLNHFFGVTEGAVDVTENVIKAPNIVKKGVGDRIKKDHVGDVDTEEIMASNNKNKNNDKSGGTDGVEEKIAPHGYFGDTEGGFFSGVGSAAETLFFVGFAGVRFDTDNVGNGVSELAGLSVFGGS